MIEGKRGDFILHPKIPLLTTLVQFNVNLSQKSDLWTEGTSDRRRKWSFRIEATEARRSVGAMNLEEESQRC